MGDCADDEAETFHGAARFSWKCNHKGKIDDRCETARQDRVRRDLHRFSAHYLSEAGQFHAHDRADRFGRDVARADARSTRRQNQAAALL